MSVHQSQVLTVMVSFTQCLASLIFYQVLTIEQTPVNVPYPSKFDVLCKQLTSTGCRGYRKWSSHCPREPKAKDKETDYIHLTNGATHLYIKFHEEKKTWREAHGICHTEGATFVKLDSEEKVTLFNREIKNKKDYAWIGLEDRHDNDTWFWTDGTRPWTYKNWAFLEPHNVNGVLKEDCGAIILGTINTGKWIDMSCYLKIAFVCEKNKT